MAIPVMSWRYRGDRRCFKFKIQDTPEDGNNPKDRVIAAEKL
jgi:hypothetical protein